MSATYPKSPPQVWGRALVATTPEHFDIRLSRCRSARHFAAGLAAERGRGGDRETRSERIDALTTRLEEVRA